MRYRPFYPGDKVIAITDYEGIPSGTLGNVASRWAGTIYLLRLPDGSFRWLSDRSFAPIDPSRDFTLEEGDVGVVTSEERQSFAKMGDKLRVYKVAYDVDYYEVLFYNKLHWFTGFQLARDI